MRLFVGIELEGEGREEVLRVREVLVDGLARQGVRFVRPEKLHVTLAFLGQVQDQDLQAVKAALDSVRGKALTVRLQPVGGFPDLRRPKVIWLGLAGEVEELGRIAAEAAQLAKPFAPELDEKPFAPHVTLARIKPGSKEVGRALTDLHVNVKPAAMHVREIVLFHSAPDGTYAKLHAVALGE